MNDMTFVKRLSALAVLAFLVAAPAVVYPLLLMKIMCFALFASAFNLLFGFAGLLSFGHAVLFGGAGYITGLMVRDLGFPLEIGLLAGVLGAGVVGFVMGIFAIRREGIYFTMITLALAQMAYFLFVHWSFTGGEDGMQNIPRGSVLGIISLRSDLSTYYVVLGICALGYGAILRIVNSPFGRVLAAIKGNEARAVSLGYDVSHFKLLAFVLSAMLSGLAGSTKALVLGFETLNDVHWSTSGLVVLMTLVGGVGTFVGPVIGAILIVGLEDQLGSIGDWLANNTHVEWFRTLGDSASIVIGLIFILCVLTFRSGIAGEMIALGKRWRRQWTSRGNNEALDGVRKLG
ncbi:branched-chain amino acid ABC transporter permease [Paraburkholderia sp. CNPSo 3076]|uniref:branched-chain amino acid ABC transporter permease n=1 Tax=Paraburkholderia sp. CNPSo 3076 TaxID=2940936 RepID=UPI00225BE99B|nr:branched-chain amino acid ABC transporter permease [Paraburkholderia sp. CNPSo 3076]MCX5542130.1 branched-chain amino acid ABC transporter permease [Paraburkholderia sp. CNPSo 3076]